MIPTETTAWQRLAELATQAARVSAADLADSMQHAPCVRELAGCTFDFSRQRITPEVIDTLLQLATSCGVEQRINAMLQGAPINTSEDRAVLHTALRDGAQPGAAEITANVGAARTRMLEVATQVRNGIWRGYTGRAITDVVHIGIGGSHLGPELVTSALEEYTSNGTGEVPAVHFVANIDGSDIQSALARCNPETTLVIVVSKSFTTLETRVNAETARSWFVERTQRPDAIPSHFLAVTSNIEAAAGFGLPDTHLLPMWDWVGGRYSLWSAVGLPIAIRIGADNFLALLDGAREMDAHLASAAGTDNIPLLAALCGIWNYNFLGASSLAVLSYDTRLALLPSYLQQLEMESNGKAVNLDGEPVTYHTMPVLWGGTGTNGQHAYHQLLHQGTRAFTADIVLVGRKADELSEHHDWLLANGLAQAEAFSHGFAAPADEPHRGVPGNHASSTILLDTLGPRQLGALLAAYEHKVLCQGAIWHINSFDQWGVELGKKLAVPIFERLRDNQRTAADPATERLAQRINALRPPRDTR